jgi:lipoprotein
VKRILKIFSVLFFVILLSGCNKNLEKVSYTDYNEYFNSKDGYTILDKSSDYDLSVIRYLEAGNGNVQVFFTEYQKTEDAKKEIEDLYKNQKNYKFKEKDNYTYVKNTKGTYFKLYRVDNVVINAVADKKYKKEVNKVLKDLGY